MLEIVVCEDNYEYREMISVTLDLLMSELKINGAVVLECASPDQVLVYLEQNSPNVFFLDIDLNAALNGLDLASLIHEKMPDAYIVFISQYANLVFKSFKVRPFDFLPKPITQNDLSDVLSEINHDYQKRFDIEKPGFLNIKTGSKIYQIPKNEIVFLEKFGNKCIIHSRTKTVYCYQSLETIGEKLGDTDFIRCHKSFLANKNFIEQTNLAEMEILFTNGQKCFIGGNIKRS